MTEHKDFDGCAITARHLGLDGHAWLVHAWDDWYYCMVKGTWENGNPTEGCLCRERADVVKRYLIRDDDGKLVQSHFAK